MTLPRTSGAAVMSASNWRHLLPPVLRRWPLLFSSFQRISSPPPPGSLPTQRPRLHAFPGLAVPTPLLCGAGILSPCSEVSPGDQRDCALQGAVQIRWDDRCGGASRAQGPRSVRAAGVILNRRCASRTLGYKLLSSRGTTALAFGLCQNRLEGLPYRLLSDPSPIRFLTQWVSGAGPVPR